VGAPLIPEARVDRIRVPEFSVPPRLPTPPPPPRLTTVERARNILGDLERTGPGQEEPGVQALLRLGPDALPALAEAFPGLLWFNRRHPHSKVAKGRDVSPVARAFVAFGEPSVPYIVDAMRSFNSDIRYYALLVALDLPQEELVSPIALAAIDGDIGVRAVAADAELGFDQARIWASSEIWKTVLTEGAAMRAHLVFAIHAVARVRDGTAARLLAALLDTVDDEVDDVACRALSVLTGQVHGPDPAPWNAWLDKNEHRTRTEWLIEALADCQPSIYRFVVSELAALTGQKFGKADVDQKRERKKLAKSYLRWWKAQARS